MRSPTEDLNMVLSLVSDWFL